MIYGGTMALLQDLIGRWGVRISEVDAADPAAVAAAFARTPRCSTGDRISNPIEPGVADIAGAAALAREAGVITVVDNTFATPLLCRPLELGADVVVHSATKYLNTSRAPTICTDHRHREAEQQHEDQRERPHRDPAGLGQVGVGAREGQRPPHHQKADQYHHRGAISQDNSGVSTATICPVSSPNLFAPRPLYSERNSTPSPSPNGISTPMMEFRSRARLPSSPITMAAMIDPVNEPTTTFAPSSRNPVAPANDSSTDPVDRERQVAHHHEGADETPDDAERRRRR